MTLEAAHREAVVRTAARDESIAHGLVGAEIGTWLITARVRPGQRWAYLATDRRSGQVKAYRGYELVRLAREAALNGLPVAMPGSPWRDEAEAA